MALTVTLVLVAAITVATVLVAGWGSAQRARGAADLAALAGAQALALGSAPCQAAEEIARHNRGRLVGCRVEGERVVASVAVELGWTLAGVPERMAATAVAGPVDAVNGPSGRAPGGSAGEEG